MIPHRLARGSTAIACVSLLLTSMAGCLDSDADAEKITAMATIVPQEHMIAAIGGDKVSVTIMVPYGQNPHSYEPTPSQMITLEEAEVYFEVGSGVEFELQNMDAIREANQDILVVDCSEGVQLKSWDEHLGGEIEGEEDQDHSTDPHIWLSPSNMKVMAQNVFDGLTEVDPDGQEHYEENLQEYLADLDDLIMNIQEDLLPYQNRSFLVYHPSWGYFGDEFGLRQIAIEEAGREPDPSRIAAIIEQARQENISVIFVSPQYDQSSAQVIAEEIGGVVATADPLMLDYSSELRGLVQNMVEGFDGD